MQQTLVFDRASLPANLLAAASSGLSAIRTIEEAIRWLVALPSPGALLASYAQDEYTHDIVFSAHLGGHPVFLVFDTT